MKFNTRLLMVESFGWKCYKQSNFNLWLKGCITSYKITELCAEIKFISGSDFSKDMAHLKELISKTKGHFAIVIDFGESIFAATDKISSIPLYFIEKKNEVIVGNYASRLKKHGNINSEDKNLNAALEIAMSGYTIGNKTIFNNLFQLTAGECLFVNYKYFL